MLAGYQVSQPFGVGFEFDFFQFNPSVGGKADLWSVGTWLTYDFSPKVGLALRAEYLDDSDGGGIRDDKDAREVVQFEYSLIKVTSAGSARLCREGSLLPLRPP